MKKAALYAALMAAFLITACSISIGRNRWQRLLNDDAGRFWRAYRQADLPAGWQMVDGALTRVAQAGDIVSREEFQDFELELEWQISAGGNSGVFFHVVEDSALSAVYLSGPEMQVLDNAGHADGRNPLTSAGSNFALHAPARDVTLPVGQWNRARLVVDGSHVEHWLNGEKIVEYELWSEDWKQRVQASKFKDMPRYGQARRGHIALQDHGDRVAYRNIRIRRIK
jgi:hypothetical protein